MKSMMKTASIIRKDIKNFEHKKKTYFTFDGDCEKNSTPKSLLQLMGGLLGDYNKISRGIVTVSQIALYNYTIVG